MNDAKSLKAKMIDEVCERFLERSSGTYPALLSRNEASGILRELLEESVMVSARNVGADSPWTKELGPIDTHAALLLCPTPLSRKVAVQEVIDRLRPAGNSPTYEYIEEMRKLADRIETHGIEGAGG